jgi:hypothetical protein
MGEGGGGGGVIIILVHTISVLNLRLEETADSIAGGTLIQWKPLIMIILGLVLF